MPSKTDRILSYLPGTFRGLPRPTALYSVADGFGNELQQAENTLVAVMRSHWVDFADQGEDVIDDLARIASLYGLAPRDDEGVEEFRAHLKHYVRTFLEGTPTVHGILRVAAEALALSIDDDYENIDTWWTRDRDALATTEPRGDDASGLLFGRASEAAGSAARPTRIMGTTNLTGGVDLTGATKLSLSVDSSAPVELDFSSLPHLSSIDPSDIVKAINAKFTTAIADCPDGHLVLTSPTSGSTSKLSIPDVAGDASPVLLGLASRVYKGLPEDAAQIVGTVDLPATVDLSVQRYLRLQIDATKLAEFDCAGTSAAATTRGEIVTAINAAVGPTVASLQGSRLALASSTKGFSSSIQFQSPAAQDATQLLFGNVTGIYAGHGPQPATVKGTRDLSAGADLSQNYDLEISIDGGPHLIVNCAGAVPAATTLAEIIAALNAAAGKTIASHNGKIVTLNSASTGPASSIQIFTAANSDASFEILGIPPRAATGQAAVVAKLTGIDIATGTVDLRAHHRLRIGLDGSSPFTVNFWELADRSALPLSSVAAHINHTAGVSVASVEGQHLTLTSPISGASSAVSVIPLEHLNCRRFVSRAYVLDEASQKTLGVYREKAVGAAAKPARVEGTTDVARGVDLRDAPFLNISVDGAAPKLIDCSSVAARPRVCLPDEVALAINNVLSPAPGQPKVASHNGHHLILTSPTPGAGSTIEFQPVPSTDAAAALGLTPAILFGHDASRVVFRGLVDIPTSLDLSTASKVKLAIDGGAPLEIDCAGADAAHTSLGEIVTRINTALGAVVAAPTVTTISLISPTTGATSRIEILAPGSSDATKLIFGVTPRAYRGSDAVPARIAGAKDLSPGVDLRIAKFLQLGSNGVPSKLVDCSDGAAKANAVTVQEIVLAINKAMAPKTVASSPDGKSLVLTSPVVGASGKIAVEGVPSDGAFPLLFGNAPKLSQGVPPTPAVITGTVDLTEGIDLSERRILRLAVNGSRPLDIDISGVEPATTFLNDIVPRINTVFPGVASASTDEHLVLTSPGGSAAETLEILPVRVLEVIEYPPGPSTKTLAVKHATHFSIENAGPADSALQFEIAAAQGVAGVELINRTTGVRIRMLDAVPAGGTLRVRTGEVSGIVAEITNAAGVTSTVRGSEILAGPLGRQVRVPFGGSWRMGGGSGEDWASLQLNNPIASGVTILRALRRGQQGRRIRVSVTAAVLPPPAEIGASGDDPALTGTLHRDAGKFQLLDAAQAVIADLRAGPGMQLERYLDQVVIVEGPSFLEGTAPLRIVKSISRLFDVTVYGTADDGSDVVEQYPGVTIGEGNAKRWSLTQQIFRKPSQFLVAEDSSKAAALQLPRGRSDWFYMTSAGARFNKAAFNHATFAGGNCLEDGVFNASLFVGKPKPPDSPPKEPEAAVFARGVADPPAQLTLHWTLHQPGTFVVNLPADLPEKFGARFNQARFARSGDKPEVYLGVVIEPANNPPGTPAGSGPVDQDWIVNRINKTSTLVTAKQVDRVEMGWELVLVPFRHPRARPLTGGNDNDPAAIYLAEDGVPGFIEIKANKPGAWGNTIEVTVRKVGPARFDVTVGYEGARFENARQTVFAGRILAPGEDPLPALTGDILKPRPVGVLQGKAAGVWARVIRDRTESESDQQN